MRRTIGIVSPAQRNRGGNTVTAARWSAIFRELGWEVCEEAVWSGRSCDVLLALHARRSHDSIVRFSKAHPDRPLIVAAAGTDVYGDDAISAEACDSFLRAARIVVLQPRAVERLPESTRGRARVVYQSVSVPKSRPPKVEDAFEACSIAHMRSVKDPLLPARAARLLPATSRLRVVHLGGVIEESLRAEVEREQRENPRFLWLGERSREETMDAMARSHLFVSSSRHEGGSNAVSEALALGVPVLATAIPGSEGILGSDHPGLFPVGDARRLAELLSRAETDREFLKRLTDRSAALGVLTDPGRERESWRALLEELAG
ncbi:MAG: selenoneine biosynthesis selenosugar synthase SenB [Planctomycetota bacterium]